MTATSSPTVLASETPELAMKAELAEKAEETEANSEKLLRELQNEINKSFKFASDVGVTALKPVDVFTGRGCQAQSHEGTKRYRKVINDYSEVYEAMPTQAKPEVTKKIVQLVREEGGGFYRHDNASGLFYEIGDLAAREKTSQSLRSATFQRRRDLRLVEQARLEAKHRSEPAPAPAPNILNEPLAVQAIIRNVSLPDPAAAPAATFRRVFADSKTTSTSTFQRVITEPKIDMGPPPAEPKITIEAVIAEPKIHFEPPPPPPVEHETYQPPTEPVFHYEPAAEPISAEAEKDASAASHAPENVRPQLIKSIHEGDAYMVIDDEEEEEEVPEDTCSSSAFINLAQRNGIAAYEREQQKKKLASARTTTVPSPTPSLSKEIEEVERQHVIQQQKQTASAQITQLLTRARLLRNMATEAEEQAFEIHRSELNESKRRENREFDSFLQVRQPPMNAGVPVIIPTVSPAVTSPQHNMMHPTPPDMAYPPRSFMRQPHMQQGPTMPPNNMQASPSYTSQHHHLRQQQQYAPMGSPEAHNRPRHHHHHTAYHPSSSMSYRNMPSTNSGRGGRSNRSSRSSSPRVGIPTSMAQQRPISNSQSAPPHPWRHQ